MRASSTPRAVTPPAADLDRRRPVWNALAELFLDTELDAADHRRIAAALAASGYADDELDRILRREVAPVVGPNLLSPAGVWDAFSGEWLAARILRRRRWRPSLPWARLVRDDWDAVRQALADQRASPRAG